MGHVNTVHLTISCFGVGYTKGFRVLHPGSFLCNSRSIDMQYQNIFLQQCCILLPWSQHYNIDMDMDMHVPPTTSYFSITSRVTVQDQNIAIKSSSVCLGMISKRRTRLEKVIHLHNQ